MVLSGRLTLTALWVLLVTSIAAADDTRAFRVHVSGTGRPVLLIPGLASSGGTWTTTVAHLNDRCTCHVLTLAGFAGTPPVGGPVFDTVRFAPPPSHRVSARKERLSSMPAAQTIPAVSIQSFTVNGTP